MDDFNDNEYASLIAELIHDSKYVNVSNGNKIATLRKHTEVMIRKILDIGSDKKLMLGEVRLESNNLDIKTGLHKMDCDLREKLIKTVKEINRLGKQGSHTQRTKPFSNEEVQKIEDVFLDLYAILFIQFFLVFPISLFSSNKILSDFSLLPPVIRYRTLNYLFEKNPNNIQVLNKLLLSMVKTFDINKAIQWLNNNMDNIKSIPYPNEDEILKYAKHCGAVKVRPGVWVVSTTLNFKAHTNVYDLMTEKINSKNIRKNESGKMYKNFEEAIDYYKANKKNIGELLESEKMFYSLMDFVYIGRKSSKELCKE